MKILLICPPSESPFKKESQYPLGLLYLQGALEKEKHQTIVQDYNRYDWEKVKDKIIDSIKQLNPDVVGLNCVTMNRTAGFKIAKIVKKINPKIKIILGGIHASSLYKQILENFPIDAIVIGESDHTIGPLINAFEKNESLKNVKGIAYKNTKNEIIVTKPNIPIHDLDSIPFPRHEVFRKVIEKTKTAVMITSRGCPFGCTFCSTSRYWGRMWRPRNYKNVVDEIESLVQTFPELEMIQFYDDTFTLNNKRVIDICNEIMKRKIKINWICAGRVDVITREMLVKMKQAGCVDISYGVESGSEKILKAIDKNITKEQVKKVIDMTNSVGLPYEVYLMVGPPGENWETVKETVKFLKTLKNVNVNSVAKLQLYPNTATYDLAKKQSLVDDSYWLTENLVPFYTYENSEDELTKMAYYIVAKNQLNQGIIKFIVFSLKFFFDKPKKAIKFIFKKFGF